jgi:hypothetical protein
VVFTFCSYFNKTEWTFMQRIIFLVLIFVLGFSISFAQEPLDDQGNPNDPNSNDRANACYSGGAMAGKCTSEWEWICGWYMIRYDNGLLSREEVPFSCFTLLPSQYTDEIALGSSGGGGLANIASGCYDGAGGNFDRNYNGTPNVVGNVSGYVTLDGTCGGGDAWAGAGITAMWWFTNTTNAVDVLAECLGVNPSFTRAYQETGFGFAVPSYVWLCLS